jgi:hypothetical protein
MTLIALTASYPVKEIRKAKLRNEVNHHVLSLPSHVRNNAWDCLLLCDPAPVNSWAYHCSDIVEQMVPHHSCICGMQKYKNSCSLIYSVSLIEQVLNRRLRRAKHNARQPMEAC